MLGMAPDYDHLPVIHKVEVFEYALDSTSGEDLHKVRALMTDQFEMGLQLDKEGHYVMQLPEPGVMPCAFALNKANSPDG